MSDLPLPHIAPIKFAQSILQTDEKGAVVKIAYDELPTIGMLVEAAAQSSAGISDERNTGRMGFLVSLKTVKLLEKIKSYEYTTKIELISRLDDFKSLKFEIFDEDKMIAKGSFAIILQ